MDFSVVLDRPEPLYATGEKIEGRVYYNGTRRVEQIGVKIWGRLKCKIMERKQSTGMSVPYRYRVCLLERSETLSFDKKTGFDGRGHCWPFSLVLPVSTKPREVDSWKAMRTTGHLEEQSLPPTFTRTGQGCGTRFYCAVDYELVTSIQFVDGGQLETDPLQLLVIMTQPSHAALRNRTHHEDYVVRGQDLLPGNGHRKSSTKDSLKALFKPHTLPTFRFRAKARVPEQLSPLEPLRLTLSLNLLADEHQDIPVADPPPISLKSLHVRVTSMTTVRLKRYTEHVAELEETIFETRLSELGLLPFGEANKKEVELGKLPYDIPTFGVTSLTRLHKMEIAVEFATPNSSHVFKLKRIQPVTVGPLRNSAPPDGGKVDLKGEAVEDDLDLADDLSTSAEAASSDLEPW